MLGEGDAGKTSWKRGCSGVLPATGTCGKYIHLLPAPKVALGGPGATLFMEPWWELETSQESTITRTQLSALNLYKAPVAGQLNLFKEGLSQFGVIW